MERLTRPQGPAVPAPPVTHKRSLRESVSRAGEFLARDGLRGLAYGLLAETGYRRLLSFERQVAPPLPSLRLPEGIEFGEFALDEAPELEGLVGAPEALRRLAAGHGCITARAGGRVVGVVWFTAGSAFVPYLGCDVAPRRSEAYLYGLFTEPALRGMNVAPGLLLEALSRLRRNSIRSVCAFVLPENRAGLRAFDKAGFRPTSVAVAWGGWRAQRFVLRRRPVGPLRIGSVAAPSMRAPSLPKRSLLALRACLSLPWAGTVIRRGQWGAAAPRAAYQPLGEPRAVVVHHSGIAAGHLRDGSSEAVYARRLQRMHLSRGWDDIGYHFVIMPSGRVFEGRPLDVLGAHVLGHNEGTVGVCLAGDFDAEQPSAAALDALSRVRLDLVPWGAVVPLCGHRDLAATSCPGDLLYPCLVQVADETAVLSGTA